MTTLLIIIGAIVVLVLILHLAAGKEMRIERTITINKPSKEVFDYLKITKNADNFSVWNMMDPDMKKEFRGTDGQVGFIYAWDSNKDKNVGAGEQEITKIEEGKSIEYDLRFLRPMQNVAKTKFVINDSGNQTNVLWGFYSPTKFPMSIMSPLFKSMLGKAVDKGLGNLKSLLEK